MFPIKTTIFFKQQSMTQPFKSVTLLEDFFGSEAGGKRRSHTGKMVLYRENFGKKGSDAIFTSLFAATRKNGLPSRNRTCDPQLRRLMLYPTELWAVAKKGLKTGW